MKATKMENVLKLRKNRKLLKKYKQKYQQEYLRKRLYFVEMVWDGFTRLEIKTKLKVSEDAMDRWMNTLLGAGLEKGLKRLMEPKKLHRRWRISPQRRKELRKILLEKSPEEYGYGAFLWTAELIQKLLWKLWKIRYKTSRIYEILDAIGLSHQKAHRDYAQADPEEQKKFTEKLKKKLDGRGDREAIEFFDEFAVTDRPTLFYGWAPKNTRPEVKSFEGSWKKLNGFLAVDSENGEEFFDFKEKSTSREVADFLVELAKKAEKKGIGKLTVVQDQNPTHRNKMKRRLRRKLKNDGVRVKVEFLSTPAYSPKYNLAEYLIHLCRLKLLHHAPRLQVTALGKRIQKFFQKKHLQTPFQIQKTVQHILSLAPSYH